MATLCLDHSFIDDWGKTNGLAVAGGNDKTTQTPLNIHHDQGGAGHYGRDGSTLEVRFLICPPRKYPSRPGGWVL